MQWNWGVSLHNSHRDNFLGNLLVKQLWNLVYIYPSYDQKSSVLLFTETLYLHVTCTLLTISLKQWTAKSVDVHNSWSSRYLSDTFRTITTLNFQKNDSYNIFFVKRHSRYEKVGAVWQHPCSCAQVWHTFYLHIQIPVTPALISQPHLLKF